MTELSIKKVLIIVGSIYTILLLVAIALSSIVVIKTGYVGLKYTFGKLDMNELEPGLHFKAPMIQNIKEVDVRLKSLNYKRAKDTNPDDNIFFYPPITALDARGLPITVEETVNVLPNPYAMAEVYAEYGPTYLETIIHPVVREITRDVLGQYKAEDIPQKRAEISAKIKQEIEKKLLDYKINGKPIFKVVEVQVRDIQLPAKIMKKIEEVQIMKQEAEKKKLEVEKAKYEQQVVLIRTETEMKKRIIEANATAQQKLIQAKAEAEATLTKAKAQAEANREIASSITPELIEYKRIEMMKYFYDALKENPNVRLFIGDNSGINYWVSEVPVTQQQIVSSK